MDNDSTDATAEVCAFFPVRHIREPLLGLSQARNCGIAHATGEIVAFLDDDAVPVDREWLPTLRSLYQDPNVAVVGGDCFPLWPDGTGRPPWLPASLFSLLAVHAEPVATSVRQLSYPHYPFGANFSVRKRTVLAAGGFCGELGYRGLGELTPGEETELCARVARGGQRVLYCPGAAVWHEVAAHKLHPEYLQRRARAQGIADAWMDRTHFRARLAHRVPKMLAVVALGLVVIPLLRRLGKAAQLLLFWQCRSDTARVYLRVLMARR